MKQQIIEEEIQRLKAEKNAIILAHYYQRDEIQKIADFVGDSLDLSRKAANSDADIIVFAGVHFMAETAKILNPGKKVLLPDLDAGCSLADSCSPSKLERLKLAHPDHVVISYINCSAQIKAMSDAVCTSANAERVIQSYPPDQKIIFVPDRHLGSYLNKKLDRQMVLWDGACIVHEAFSFQKLLEIRLKHPSSLIIAHPESESHVLELADFIGSTRQLIDYVKNHTSNSFIVATEAGILYKMQEETQREVELIPVPIHEENQCACSECAFMKVNTLEKLRDCLKYESPEIILEQSIMERAKSPIEHMLSLS